MKKDIEIPEVREVHIAIAHEWNDEIAQKEWNVYIINQRKDPIEMVLVVSKGYDGEQKTSIMRHALKVVAANSFEKIELVQEEVFALNNEFYVTFFAENKMYERKFLFPKNSIHSSKINPIPVLYKEGIYAI